MLNMLNKIGYATNIYDVDNYSMIKAEYKMNRYAMLNGQLTTNNLHNIEVVRGEKQNLIDVNNRRYVDLSSGLWNVSLGYNEELNFNIKEKFMELLDKNIPYVDMTSYFHELYNSVAEKYLTLLMRKILTEYFILIVVRNL